MEGERGSSVGVSGGRLSSGGDEKPEAGVRSTLEPEGAGELEESGGGVHGGTVERTGGRAVESEARSGGPDSATGGSEGAGRLEESDRRVHKGPEAELVGRAAGMEHEIEGGTEGIPGGRRENRAEGSEISWMESGGGSGPELKIRRLPMETRDAPVTVIWNW